MKLSILGMPMWHGCLEADTASSIKYQGSEAVTPGMYFRNHQDQTQTIRMKNTTEASHPISRIQFSVQAAIDVSIMTLELLKCRQLKTLGITYKNKHERTPKGGEKADWLGTLAPEE